MTKCQKILDKGFDSLFPRNSPHRTFQPEAASKLAWAEMSVITKHYILPHLGWIFRQLPCRWGLPVLVTYSAGCITIMREVIEHKLWGSKDKLYLVIIGSLGLVYLLPLLDAVPTLWNYNWIFLLIGWRFVVLMAIEPFAQLRLEPFDLGDQTLNCIAAHVSALALQLNPDFFLPQSLHLVWHSFVWSAYLYAYSMHERAIARTKIFSVAEKIKFERMA